MPSNLLNPRTIAGIVLLIAVLAFSASRDRVGGRESQRSNQAGSFDYYALVLSWSPTHCETPEAEDDHMQCNPRGGRPFAFVLHGLWPQHERGYPERCWTREHPFVPERVINSMLDIMPSRGLVIHEYRTHGTCSGLDPTGYYDQSRRLFEKIRIPARFRQPRQQQIVDRAAVVSEFVAENPGLRPDMLAVSCGGTGNRIKEVRICFTRDGRYRSCGENESQRRLCRADRLFVPPVR